MAGDANANIIKGGGGDDWIDATAGADSYDGGDGFDTVDYSATAFVSGSEQQVYYDYSGNPYYYTTTAPAMSWMPPTASCSGSTPATASPNWPSTAASPSCGTPPRSPPGRWPWRTAGDARERSAAAILVTEPAPRRWEASRRCCSRCSGNRRPRIAAIPPRCHGVLVGKH